MDFSIMLCKCYMITLIPAKLDQHWACNKVYSFRVKDEKLNFFSKSSVPLYGGVLQLKKQVSHDVIRGERKNRTE